MAEVQYTIRNVPGRLDRKIREIAAKEGKSLNETVIALLKAAAGVSEVQVRYSDLDELAGTWIEDPEFDRAISEMDRVDPELWK